MMAKHNNYKATNCAEHRRVFCWQIFRKDERTMFDISSFVIDRAIRGTMFRKGTFDLLWTLTQITDPSLNMTADSEDAVDAIGVPIMTWFA